MPPTGELQHKSIRVRLTDRPGSLHLLTRIVARDHVNIVRLEIASWEGSDVWDDIELRGDRRRLDSVMAALRASGMEVIGLPSSWVIGDWAAEVLAALQDLTDCPDSIGSLDSFTGAAASLTHARHAFLLAEPQPPHADSAWSRWEMVRRASLEFDPETTDWAGDVEAVAMAVSAMRAAREGRRAGNGALGSVAAAVDIPAFGGRPAALAVIGDRPPFLASEIGRLRLFARVAAPHVLSMVPVSA